MKAVVTYPPKAAMIPTMIAGQAAPASFCRPSDEETNIGSSHVIVLMCPFYDKKDTNPNSAATGTGKEEETLGIETILEERTRHCSFICKGILGVTGHTVLPARHGARVVAVLAYARYCVGDSAAAGKPAIIALISS